MVHLTSQQSQVKAVPTTQFLREDSVAPSKDAYAMPWNQVTIPECVQLLPLVATLRAITISDERQDQGVETEVDIKKAQDSQDEDTIEARPTENIFSKEMTDADMDIIQKRVAQQQRQFAEFEKRDKARKYSRITELFDYLTEEEMDEMLDDCSNEEEEVIVRLTQPGYLVTIRKIIATKFTPEVSRNINELMSKEQQAAYQQLVKKRSETRKKTTNDNAKQQYRMGGRLALDDAVKQVQENRVDPQKAFEGWSQARIRAYQMIDQNPNGYYYRFNAPGEVQRTGQWSYEERKLFLERLDEIGATGQWGIFAMKIPGRVGYQCSTFYRQLVEAGEVRDPNYVLDEKGKARYLFDKKTADGQVKKTFRTHSKHGTGRGSGIPSSSRASSAKTRAAPNTDKKAAAAAGGAKKRKRAARGWDNDDDEAGDFEDYNDDSGEYTTRLRSATTTRRTRSRLAHAASISPSLDESLEDRRTTDVHSGCEEQSPSENDDQDDSSNSNPLPGFIDPITLDEVVKPAISKYGHVMGYHSWVRCLSNWEGKRNICPLTKKPLTRRDLVILTMDNIDEYREQIINM